MIKVSVPATSANCSIGFDSLGLALEWRGNFLFEQSDELRITGCPAEYCDENNLTVQSFWYVCERFGLEKPAFRLEIDCDVPFARGLGSSSVCTAAGILAADAWFDLHLSAEQLVELAAELEGHPDNVAPAILGGLTACFSRKEGGVNRLCYARMLPESFRGLAVIPDYEVSTPMARKVLPAQIPLHDAAVQTGRALVFEQAMVRGDEKLLFDCCLDVYHEPYRRKLIPDYDWLHELSEESRIPFWISGSGSTMMYFSVSEEKLEKLKEKIQARKPGFICRILKVAEEGAKVSHV